MTVTRRFVYCGVGRGGVGRGVWGDVHVTFDATCKHVWHCCRLLAHFLRRCNLLAHLIIRCSQLVRWMPRCRWGRVGCVNVRWNLLRYLRYHFVGHLIIRCNLLSHLIPCCYLLAHLVLRYRLGGERLGDDSSMQLASISDNGRTLLDHLLCCNLFALLMLRCSWFAHLMLCCRWVGWMM